MRTFDRSVVAGAAVLVVIAAARSPALAQYDLRGVWTGYGRVADRDTDTLSLASFEILAQNQRRFSGVVHCPDPGRPDCPVAGTISEAGVLSAVGGVDGRRLALHGRVRDLVRNAMPPGPNYPPNPCLVGAFYYTMVGHAASQQGFLLFVQNQRGPQPDQSGPPDVNSSWSGLFASGSEIGGEFGLDLQQTRESRTGVLSTAFGGSASFDDSCFILQGTIGLPFLHEDGTTRAPVVAIAVQCPESGSPDLVSLIVGTCDGSNSDQVPMSIQGGYALYGSFFDVFFDMIHHTGNTLSEGTFFATPDEQT